MKKQTLELVKPKKKEDNSKGNHEAKSKELKTKETERLEAEIMKVKAMKKGRAIKVFKIRETISGSKKAG